MSTTNKPPTKKPKRRGRPKLTHKRVLLQTTVLPATLRAIERAARAQDVSLGRVVDHAMAASTEASTLQSKSLS